MGEQLPTLIQAMLTPDFYGDKGTKNVTLIQTHISYLLLGDQYTYKIKKSLDLGFLDFRKLEDRKRFCEEEIRLNTKLAPLLYIKAVPIYQHEDGQYSLTHHKKANIVEYAVKMHTFNNNHLFSQLFEDQKLQKETFQTLARQLAQHHIHAAKTSDHIASFGRPENIRSILNGNFSVVDKYVEKTISRDFFDQLKHESYAQFNENKSLYTQRIKVGKIRENHGDIHLNNICLYKGEVQIFDCIEFTEQFKNIDCIYDVAFLFMDLIYRDHTAFAYTFLNEYLEHTGDYDALKLLPLYASMRAFIRGKVISIEAGDEQVPAHQRKEAAQKAHSYFKLAQAFLRPHKGKVIIVSGVSGSGKSTLSKSLYSRMGAIHLRSDVIRKHLTNSPLYEKAKIYDEEITLKTYQHLLSLSIEITKSGYDVIVDATFLDEALRKMFAEGFEENKITYHWLWCTAQKQTLEKRLENRQGDVSDADVHILHQQLKNTTKPKEIEMTEVNTEVPHHLEQLATLIGFI